MAFQAKYPSYCENCEERIHVGELVTFENGVVVHEDCVPRVERPETVCSKCFLTSCDCES